MSNFVDTLTEFEQNHPDLYWSVGKGRLTEAEPLYGAIIYLGETEIGNGESHQSIEAAFNTACDSAGLQSRGRALQSVEPVAWLRCGEPTPVQGVPFGANWITDKDDPHGFPVYTHPPVGAGWLPIETAPKDGTHILIWFVHENAKYSKDPISEGWAAAHEAYWINHNKGGWTWHGLCGVATYWHPMPVPPLAALKSEAS